MSKSVLFASYQNKAGDEFGIHWRNEHSYTVPTVFSITSGQCFISMTYSIYAPPYSNRGGVWSRESNLHVCALYVYNMFCKVYTYMYVLSQSSLFFYVCLTLCSSDVTNQLFNCSEGDAKYPLFFIGYFPCEPTPSSAPEECDYFLHSAIDVAETLLQENRYYSNSCFTIQMSRYSKLTDEVRLHMS